MQMTLVGCVNGKCESARRPNPVAAPTTRHLGTEDIAGTTRTPGGRPLPIAGRGGVFVRACALLPCMGYVHVWVLVVIMCNHLPPDDTSIQL